MEWLHAHIGSRNATLQERPKVFQSIRVYAAIYVLHGVIHDLVCIVTRQTFIRKQRISVKGRTSLDMLSDFGLQCPFATIWYNGRTDLSATLQNSHDCGFVLRPGPGDSTLSFAYVHVPRLAADKRFIGLYFATESTTENVILHRKSDAVH